MQYILAKHLVHPTKNDSWFGTNYNMNIYKGCCHGCIYCDSRSDCYRIENFGEVRAKENALGIIRADLRGKKKSGVIATGAMSDPYNPFEAEHKLTRGALEIIENYGFGVAIDTKGALITRDIDVLKGIVQNAPVLCKITITTARDDIAKLIEPGAPSSSARFEAVQALSAAGLNAGVLMMPVLPFITDAQGEASTLVERAAAHGAKFIFGGDLTMRAGQCEYFYKKLDENFPGENLAVKYDREYGSDYHCPSPRSREVWREFKAACEKHGILYKMADIIALYKGGYGTEQLSMF